MIEERFGYDPQHDPDIRPVGERVSGSAKVREFTFRTPAGVRRAAFLVRPAEETGKPHPAVMFVHWYEPESHDSNRTQFLPEAIELAGHGVVSLLVEAMWSDREWFLKRTQADDLSNAAEQVVELRQAVDLLLAEPGVSPEWLFYVGHDFGGMYGILMGAVDPRPCGFVIMAATPRFPDWFLYYPRLSAEEAQAFRDSFIPYDPITRVASLSPAPLLFQFADNDPHVPLERARAFYEAAAEPKEVGWYQAGHGLNDQARQDRLAWLLKQMNIK